MTLQFGKYSGKSICDVPTEYLVWAMKAYPLQPAQRVLIREEVLRRLGVEVATCSSPVPPALRPLAEKLVASAADFRTKQAENEEELTQILAVRDILLSVIWGSDAPAAVEASRLASWSLPAVADLPQKTVLKGYGEIWLASGEAQAVDAGLAPGSWMTVEDFWFVSKLQESARELVLREFRLFGESPRHVYMALHHLRRQDIVPLAWGIRNVLSSHSRRGGEGLTAQQIAAELRRIYGRKGLYASHIQTILHDLRLLRFIESKEVESSAGKTEVRWFRSLARPELLHYESLLSPDSF